MVGIECLASFVCPRSVAAIPSASPNGARHHSPGQRPGDTSQRIQSPERAGQGREDGRLPRPCRACPHHAIPRGCAPASLAPGYGAAPRWGYGGQRIHGSAAQDKEHGQCQQPAANDERRQRLRDETGGVHIQCRMAAQIRRKRIPMVHQPQFDSRSNLDSPIRDSPRKRWATFEKPLNMGSGFCFFRQVIFQRCDLKGSALGTRLTPPTPPSA